MAGETTLTKRIFAVLAMAARYRLFLRLFFLALLGLSIFLIVRTNFTNDLAEMLPDNSRSALAFQRIANSPMFNKVIVVFHLKQGVFSGFRASAGDRKNGGTPQRQSLYHACGLPLLPGIAERGTGRDYGISASDFRAAGFFVYFAKCTGYCPENQPPPLSAVRRRADRLSACRSFRTESSALPET